MKSDEKALSDEKLKNFGDKGGLDCFRDKKVAKKRVNTGLAAKPKEGRPRTEFTGNAKAVREAVTRDRHIVTPIRDDCDLVNARNDKL